jgi:starch synthase
MAFFAALIRAMETYRYKNIWESLVKRCMKQDFSWVESAKKYSDLYYRTIELKRQKKIAKTHPQLSREEA